MSARRRLTPAEIRESLKRLKGWTRNGSRLERSYAFDAYTAGLEFAVRLGRLADSMDHHPDLRIGYETVTVAWTTHDSAGITRKDFDGARITDMVYRESRNLPPMAAIRSAR